MSAPVTRLPTTHINLRLAGEFAISVRCMISLQNYSGSKRKSYRVEGMKIFAIFERTKPNTEKIVVLKLAAVKFVAKVTRLLLSEYYV